ncbi:Neu5Ac permease [Oligella ureolytica]|uniref:Neu5Ac permease n=1 Tax=Oligella ureolytica TaxID=90244 RepID=A0A378XJT6_9BURK|nr:TRAP transporter large permease subunit [Oligella ureolytica]QPT39815.1 TRAP transporter large permease subunit [Oligella ureolytica]SUA57639.1 Neu5Ac permease [Oligella ureolytica]
MVEFIVANMPPIMFLTLIGFLLLGFPVAFSLAANGIFYAVLGIFFGEFSFQFLQALPNRIFGIVQNDTLLAVPFFTLMGLVLERSGMAEDLLDTIGEIFGPVRGGLAIAVVFVGALLAATTGVVAASVISMGLISLPIMMRYGYDRRLATGVIAASGTLSQIIPPSLVLIILADQVGRSVGDVYRGAMIPALSLVGIYILVVIIVSLVMPKSAPAIPTQDRKYMEDNGRSGLRSLLITSVIAGAISYWIDLQFIANENTATDEKIVISLLLWGLVMFAFALVDKYLRLHWLSRITSRVVFVMVPPLLLIFLVLGTIFLGIATPTEGGAMGAVGSIVLAWSRGRLSLPLLKQAMESTTILTSFVIFILVGSTIFTLTFTGFGGQQWVNSLFTDLPGGVYGFLIVVSIFIFLLAFFLDYFELAFIVVPLLAPVAESLGIDLVWFAVLLAVNMQTSFMHPPFGFALFFLRSVAPKEAYIDKITKKRIEGIKTTEIYWGAVPFIMIQLCMVGVVLAFPGLVTHYKGTAPKVDPTTIQIGIDSYGSSYGNDPYASDPFGSSGGDAYGADPYAADSFDSNSGSDEGIKSGPDAEESNSLQNEHQQTDSRDPYDIGFQ